MFRIAFCDNDGLELETSSALVISYLEGRPEMQGELETFDSSSRLLSDLKGGKEFDLYLLDILMPDVDGIELGRVIHRIDPRALIIYLTSSREYAFEAFGVSAMQYLLKPVDRQNLFAALDKAFEYRSHIADEKLNIDGKDGISTVSIDDIVYVENVSRTAVYHLEDESTVVSLCSRGTFEENIAPLPDHPNFIHPHKSFFVNMRYIRTLSQSELVLDDGRVVPVSRRNASLTKKCYLRFIAHESERPV